MPRIFLQNFAHWLWFTRVGKFWKQQFSAWLVNQSVGNVYCLGGTFHKKKTLMMRHTLDLRKFRDEAKQFNRTQRVYRFQLHRISMLTLHVITPLQLNSRVFTVYGEYSQVSINLGVCPPGHICCGIIEPNTIALYCRFTTSSLCPAKKSTSPKRSAWPHLLQN